MHIHIRVLIVWEKDGVYHSKSFLLVIVFHVQLLMSCRVSDRLYKAPGNLTTSATILFIIEVQEIVLDEEH